MIEKLFVLFCCAGIVIAGEINNGYQIAPMNILTALPTPVPASDVATAHYPIPLEARILQQGANVNFPAIYTNPDISAQYSRNAGIYRYLASPDSNFVISPAAVKVTSASVAAPNERPVLVQQPAQYHQEINERPTVQYVTRPTTGVINVKEALPVAPKKVTIEAQKTVTVHPPPKAHVTQPIQADIPRPPVQYVPATYPATPSVLAVPQVYYAQGHTAVNNAIAEPVTYNTDEAFNPQYTAVSNQGQQVYANIRYQAPISIPQTIPAPVVQNQAPIRYKVSAPVVYTKSIAQLYGGRPNPYNGYSRAVTYSPASAVSSVRFSGLGVTYGW